MRASKRSIEVTDAWLLVGSALIAVVVPRLLGYKVIVTAPWEMQVLVVLGFVFAFRLLLSPYWIWSEVTEENEVLRNSVLTKERKAEILGELGEVWERATHFLNDLAKKPQMSADDHKTKEGFDNEIYRIVGLISRVEVSPLRTMRTISKKFHPSHYWTENRGGDKTLLIFSERLRRLQEFMDRHSQPGIG